MTPRPPLLIISGPTASGKSAVALRLASQHARGEIISADSMQLYRGLDIATAKPSLDEQALVTHHLIDICEPAERFSVADYLDLASQTINDCLASGAWPIVAGGTGQYIDALARGIRFDDGLYDEGLRQTLLEQLQSDPASGALAQYERLKQLDPDSAQTIDPRNHKRVMRSLEICLLSGKPASLVRQEARLQPSPYNSLVCIPDWPRAVLYERINTRVDQMLEQGLLEEARQVYDLDLPAEATCRQAIGYKELFPYFEGRQTLAEAVTELKAATRHYAKRQLTWFRHKDYVHFFPCAEAAEIPAALARRIEALWQDFLSKQ
ncbi:tRNA (adenosine(37)-N6)-dimethylallyltransferase MiaA [Oscillospiraceae bacterium HV4-5-C5C]|nr:tRNA (adenosine(37)-N6)-dimethylallyltransferase MiaA [Oscillospiraceae bacterium HV4-5-C5C]